MKVRHYIADLLQEIGRNRVSEPERFTERFLLSNLVTGRLHYYKNLSRRYPILNQNTTQVLGVEKEVNINKEDSSRVSEKTGKEVFVTEPLPKFLIVDSTIYARVRTVDSLLEEIPIVSLESSIYKGNSRFNKKLLYCYLDYNNKIYLKPGKYSLGHEFMEKVLIEGFFEDFERIEYLKGNTDFRDIEYPINHQHWFYIRNLILSNLAGGGEANETTNQVQ